MPHQLVKLLLAFAAGFTECFRLGGLCFLPLQAENGWQELPILIA
jgi:hypothetical protein